MLTEELGAFDHTERCRDAQYDKQDCDCSAFTHDNGSSSGGSETCTRLGSGERVRIRGKFGLYGCQCSTRQVNDKPVATDCDVHTLLRSARADKPKHDANAHGTANQDRPPSI